MQFIGKFARLNKIEQKVRLGLLEWLIDNGGEMPREQAVRLTQEILNKNSEKENDLSAEHLLDDLEERHYFRCTKERAICYLYPYSAYKTDYKVMLEDGRSFFAMCAIDSMGTAVTLNQSLTVISHCRDTKEEIELKVDPVKGLTKVSPDYNIIATYYDTIGNWKEFNC